MTAVQIARAVRLDNERIRREACATCGDRCAPFTCAWACEQFQPGLLRDLCVGDVVRRYRDVDGTRPGRAIVEEIEPRPRIGKILVVIGVRYKNGRSREWRVIAGPMARLRVLRPGVCGARACERHVREVGEGRHYCRAHWRTWMEEAR